MFGRDSLASDSPKPDLDAPFFFLQNTSSSTSATMDLIHQKGGSDLISKIGGASQWVLHQIHLW
jgi:hypothetical protein